MLAALADERDRERRADLEWRAAMMHFLAGELGPCIELLEAGRAHASDPSLRAQISTRLASMYCWVNDFPRSVQVAETIDIDRLDGVYRSNALSVICVANFGAGRSAAPDPWQIVADFEQLHPAPPAHEHPVIRLMVMLTLHDAAEVARVAGCALERAVADADDVGIAWLAATMAHAELRAGRWEVAARAADDSLRAGRRAGSAPALVFGLGAAATVCAYRAEVDAAARYAAELVAIGDGQPLLCCLEHGQLVLGFLALSRGDASTARAEYLRACQALDRGLPIQPALPALRWHLIDVLIDAGDVGEAGRRIEELAALADHPLAAAVAATGRGRIAAQQGDRDGADAAFGEALLAHDRLRWPFERAVTLYRQGCALRDQRRRTLARQALGEAEQLFAGLGSPLWAARAGDALAGISGRAPSAPDALTPTEDEVANLAASGLTNQEIADRMFISAKTVATHLSHVYAKLHVRSRTELAACLPHRSG
jgi:DNA-binding CsgD family transcriptional regulator